MLTTLLEQPLLDTDALAAKIGVSPDTVHNWTTQRRIPCFRLGHRTVRYSFPAVIAALSKFYTPSEKSWTRKLPRRRRALVPPQKQYQVELALTDAQLVFPFANEPFLGRPNLKS